MCAVERPLEETVRGSHCKARRESSENPPVGLDLEATRIWASVPTPAVYTSLTAEVGGSPEKTEVQSPLGTRTPPRGTPEDLGTSQKRLQD